MLKLKKQGTTLSQKTNRIHKQMLNNTNKNKMIPIKSSGVYDLQPHCNIVPTNIGLAGRKNLETKVGKTSARESWN